MERFPLLIYHPSQYWTYHKENDVENNPFITWYIAIVFLLTARVQSKDFIEGRFFCTHFVAPRSQDPNESNNDQCCLNGWKNGAGIILGRVPQVISKYVLIQHYEPKDQQGVPFHNSEERHY